MARPRTVCEHGDYPKPGKVGTARGLALHVARMHPDEPTSPGRNGAGMNKGTRRRGRPRSPETRLAAVLTEVYPYGIPVDDAHQLSIDLEFVEQLRARL